MALIFLDTETTHLDAYDGSLIEASWVRLDSGEPIQTYFAAPLIDDRASPEALEVNGYYTRGLHRRPADSPLLLVNLVTALRGNTVVGSNPGFDLRHLTAHGIHPVWHYKPLDICVYAAGVLGLPVEEKVPGLAGIATLLGIRPGDHSSADDVRCLVDVWQALRRAA